MLAALRNPGKWVVEWIHHPEDETVEGLHLGKAKLFDYSYLTLDQWPADLLQCQFQMWHISRLDPYKLAAGQINGQVIASGYQHLQISFISIKWPFTILSHAAIDDGEGWFDAQVHIHYALIDANGLHGAPIRAWQYAHGILHTERHN